MHTSLALTFFLTYAAAAPTAYNPSANVTNSTLTASSAAGTYPFTSCMNTTIEGASVDRHGNFYAVNKTAFANLKTGGAVLSISGGDASTYQWASSRWTRTLGLLVGDAISHAVTQLRDFSHGPTALIRNESMLQPNDMAITRDERFVYFSGMNYSATTTAGASGDLWYYDTGAGVLSQVPAGELAAAGIHRTNGIELMPDDRTLLVTSARNDGGNVTAAVIYAFSIDPATGRPENPLPVLDLYASVPGAREAQMDPDGMRVDAEGSVFLALNAFRKVLKWTPTTGARELIDLQTVAFPANLEFAGADGKELVVIGRCADMVSSCSDSYQHQVAGKAWTNLQGVY